MSGLADRARTSEAANEPEVSAIHSYEVSAPLPYPGDGDNRARAGQVFTVPMGPQATPAWQRDALDKVRSARQQAAIAKRLGSVSVRDGSA